MEVAAVATVAAAMEVAEAVMAVVATEAADMEVGTTIVARQK
jgi:hypothetical protein